MIREIREPLVGEIKFPSLGRCSSGRRERMHSWGSCRGEERRDAVIVQPEASTVNCKLIESELDL